MWIKLGKNLFTNYVDNRNHNVLLFVTGFALVADSKEKLINYVFNHTKNEAMTILV